MLTEFEGKVAVVTGAASGIGRAMCEKFAGLGMNVVMADVEAERLRHSVEQIEANGADRGERGGRGRGTRRRRRCVSGGRTLPPG